MKRALIFIRTSEQSKENMTMQHEACRGFCKGHDFSIVGAITEVGNGQGLNDRPKLTMLRDMVRSGLLNVVVVYNLGRLTVFTDELTVLVREAEEYHVDIVSIFELMSGEDITPLRAEAMTSERERAAHVLCRIEQDRIARHRLAAQARFH